MLRIDVITIFPELFEPFRSGHSRRWGYTLTGVVSGRSITAFE